jgi:hypothetical protein
MRRSSSVLIYVFVINTIPDFFPQPAGKGNYFSDSVPAPSFLSYHVKIFIILIQNHRNNGTSAVNCIGIDIVNYSFLKNISMLHQRKTDAHHDKQHDDNYFPHSRIYKFVVPGQTLYGLH